MQTCECKQRIGQIAMNVFGGPEDRRVFFDTEIEVKDAKVKIKIPSTPIPKKSPSKSARAEAA